MSYEPPTPPANLPTEIVNTLNESTSEHLRDVATYAEALAEHKEHEARLEEETDQDEVEERPDDLPDNVPAKATITIKEINDNRYYYWQWREFQRGHVLRILRVPFEWLGDAIPFDELLDWHRSSVEPVDSVLETIKYCVWRLGRVEPFETVPLDRLDERWG